MQVTEPVSLQALVLANHVEAPPNGLLYISGAGMTLHNRVIMDGAPPPISHLGVAVILSVPWHETNRLITVNVEIHDEDGNPPLVSVQGQMNVGRHPMLPPGTVQYPSIGLPFDIIFPKEGGYSIVAQVEGQPARLRWMFTVKDVKQPSLRIA